MLKSMKYSVSFNNHLLDMLLLFYLITFNFLFKTAYFKRIFIFFYHLLFVNYILKNPKTRYHYYN
jgi:hypothetical protein